jgi:hypothetical protein
MTETHDENIARLCRQICLCRTRGQAAEASRFELMLRNHISAGFSKDALQEIFSAEQHRVLDALMLAEVLGPLLTEQLATLTSEATRAPAASSRNSQPRVTPARPPAIADLIDGMLEQERATHGHAA